MLVYVTELMDEERRRRMIDIGIQTGVLARVQHIYETVDTDLPPEVEVARPAIRLSEAENVDDSSSLESSKAPSPRPSSSVSVPHSPVDRLTTSPQLLRTKPPTLRKFQAPAEVQNRVSDLRSRFERGKPDLRGSQRRTRSSSAER
ncbi:hypothetical protein OSTOST_20332 [Ostertagia ostertagi]